MKKISQCVVLLLTLFICQSSMALINTESDAYRLKDLTVNEQGYLQNTTSDGFLILKDIDTPRANACGLLVDLEFAQAPVEPFVMELFWRTERHGFMEKQKSFFVVKRDLDKKRQQFIVPLCKLYLYSGNINIPAWQGNITGIRLDYPPDRDLAIKFHDFSLINHAQTFAQADLHYEPYERVNTAALLSRDVLLTKLILINKEGLQRFVADKAFLIVWLLMIVALSIALVKSFVGRKH